LLFLAISANAATIVYNGAAATGIAGLNIGGTLYNVDFGANSGFSTFGGDEFYWDTHSEATTAVDTINTQLNANNVSFIDNLSTYSFYTVHFGPPSYSTPNHEMGQFGGESTIDFYNLGAWSAAMLGQYDGITGRTAWSLAAVPVPAAVWLFGSALAGLGWLRRKQSI
jgi:hypothetical protein